MKRAIFPGSFDPFTIGHESIVLRALKLFDEIIIAIGCNTKKTSFFSIEDRMQMIEDVFHKEPKIKIKQYDSLTVDFCKKEHANFIIRGLRTSSDFEYERSIAQMNHFMEKKIETVFLLTEAKNTPVSSTVLRELLKYGTDISKFMPESIDIKKYSDKKVK